jgi:hypothetical protein
MGTILKFKVVIAYTAPREVINMTPFSKRSKVQICFLLASSSELRESYTGPLNKHEVKPKCEFSGIG